MCTCNILNALFQTSSRVFTNILSWKRWVTTRTIESTHIFAQQQTIVNSLSNFVFSVSNAVLCPFLALAPKEPHIYCHQQQHINKNAFWATHFIFSNRDCHVNNARYRDRTLRSSCEHVCHDASLLVLSLYHHVLLHSHHVFYCQIIHAVSLHISIALFLSLTLVTSDTSDA